MALNLADLDALLADPRIPAIHAAARGAPHAIPSVPDVAQPPASAPSLPTPSAGIPDLAKPTGAESRAAGKAEFQRGIPNVNAAPFTPDYFQQEREKSDYLRAHPWGSDVSAHPGAWGKLGHVAAKIGNVAGDIVAPGTMALIPGTDLHNELERGAQLKGFNQAIENEQKQALTGEEQAQTWKALHPEPQSAEWKPIGESGWEVSGRSGETQEIPGFQPPTKETKKDWVAAVNPDTQKPEYYDREAGKFTGVSPFEKPEGDKAPPHITALGKDGKSHIMERDPATGEYSIDRGLAPPNYAQVAPSLRTVDVLNPQGVPTVQTLSGKTIGQAATGAYGHSEAQAGAVQRAGTELINTVQANKAKFGNVQAILNSAFLGTPLADPVSAGLASQIASFAALNPSMHGFRGQDALREFEKLIGGLPNNPDALVTGIQGIMKTAGAINPNLPQGNGPQTGTVEDGYRFKGGDPADKNNWEKVK